MAESASRGSDELLRCERLVIGHGGRALLPPIDVSLRRGELWAVIGRNGAGKSTWLKTVLGMQPPIGGRLERLVPRERFAYVAQRAGLDAILPVQARDIVGWGRLRGWSFLRPLAPAGDRARCSDALVHAEASMLASRRYAELSEGQKQRVLFARMLATDADLVLLDEPTAAMDMVAEREVMERLEHLAHDHDRAVVIVSHFLGLVQEYADRLLFLDADGGVALAGTVAEVMGQPEFRRRYGSVLGAA